MAAKGRIEQSALPVPVAEPAPRLEVVDTLSYPDSDGHFLPDNPLQANAVMELRISLREHFRGVPDVVVEGDMFIYYARGEADERRVRGGGSASTWRRTCSWCWTTTWGAAAGGLRAGGGAVPGAGAGPGAEPRGSNRRIGGQARSREAVTLILAQGEGIF